MTAVVVDIKNCFPKDIAIPATYYILAIPILDISRPGREIGGPYLSLLFLQER
jgi:hypothetical protein